MSSAISGDRSNSRADQERLSGALARLGAGNPSFHISTDQESGQTILKGMSELHLAAKVELLKQAYKVDAKYRRAAGAVP
jgi:elongation factor G